MRRFLDYLGYLGWRAGVLLKTRAVKLTFATFALVTSLLLFNTALAVESLWAFLAAGLGVWVGAGAFTALVWSAARRDLGPHPRLILDPRAGMSDAELEDMFARLDRDMGGDGR